MRFHKRTSIKRNYKKEPNRITEIEKYNIQSLKNSIQGLNNRLELAEERISELKRQINWYYSV